MLSRRAMVRAIIITVIIFVTAISAIGIYRATYFQEYLFVSLIKSGFAEIESRFREVVGPVADNVAVVRGWGQEGLLDIEDSQALTEQFLPVLEQLHQVSAMALADSAGSEYRLQQVEEGWLARLLSVNNGVRQASFVLMTEPRTIVREWVVSSSDDPRKLDWFVSVAKDSFGGELHWTDSSTLFKDGIAVSTGWQTRSGTADGAAVAFYVPESNLTSIVAADGITNEGHTVVLDQDGDVVLEIRNSSSGVADDRTVIENAVQLWRDKGVDFLDPFAFRVSGHRWWAGFRPFALGEHGFWVGVLLPETKFRASLPVSQNALFGAILGVAALGIVATLWLGRRPSPSAVAPTETPDVGVDEGQRLLEILRAGESETVEFKSTMRWNLGKDKPGKEVELSWLKTVVAFLNSSGGTLLIGVGDDGEVLGIDADRFPNEDKYLLHVNNLLSQHIGTEFSHCLRFSLRSVTDRKLLMIECQPSADPVFLRINKEEEFYVRSGPASRKLSPSKLLQYLSNRQS